MIKINKHIEIVRSSARGLSSMSRESADAILIILSQHYDEVSISHVNNLSDLQAVVADQPDLVFLGMEFIPLNPALGRNDPDKVWLSDYLDEQGIAYTGSSQAAHELERHKPLAKQRVLDAGLMTAAYQVVKAGQTLQQDDVVLTFPLFVKPSSQGGGMGIDSASVVHDFTQLAVKVHSITVLLRMDALIEEYLPGREFSVAILNDGYPSEHMVMPIELVAPLNINGARLLSSQVKTANSEQSLAVTDEALRAAVCSLAWGVFEALGARDYGRIDIRLGTGGVPYFLEANLIPSLISGYGSFPKACVLNIGLEYEPMILRIVRLGLARNRRHIKELLVPANARDFPAGIIEFKPV